MQQATEQVKKAMEIANSALPLPHFEYEPTMGCEPSYRCIPGMSHRHNDEVREVSCSNRGRQSWREDRDQSVEADDPQSRHLSQGRPVTSTTASTLYAMHSRCTAWFEEQQQTSRPRGETSGEDCGSSERNMSSCSPNLGRKSAPPEQWPPLSVDSQRVLLGPVGKLQGHQRTARDCYLVSIWPLVDDQLSMDPRDLSLRTKGCGPHHLTLLKP
ncbi:hypothetical protein Cgig2_027159 [Carnegiea gigantea]|uniref:Uncharacterized protein n=1 Tax=Carnegiea gigantea TaxID=171969 RepID=A0A9Q1QNW2_9CARY|nr:hypothetical protein Cgig2_027159 [Carnegiea gigantea]